MTKLITKKQLFEKVPYSNTELIRKENAGTFPRRIKPFNGPNGKCFWLDSAVEDWIEKQVAASDHLTDTSS